MKIANYIGIAFCCIVGLVSCEMREEILGNQTGNGQTGTLVLAVEAADEVSTKAPVDTEYFDVVIEGVSEGITDVKINKTVKALKESIDLQVGTYKITATSPGTLLTTMTKPYYEGSKTLVIEKSKLTEETVQCAMVNTRVQVKYTDDFTRSFKSWIITLDDDKDGTEKIEVKTNSVGEDPKPIYWNLGKNGSRYITMNVAATKEDGSVISFSKSYYKKDAESGNGNDSNFTGGEALVITLKTEPEDLPATGQVTGIAVAVELWSDKDRETVSIPVFEKDNGATTPDTPSTPETPDGDGPSLKLPDDVTYSISKEGSMPGVNDADANIKAPKGLKSIQVKITGGNNEFNEILADLVLDGQSFIDGKGVNLVDNKDFSGLLNSYDLPAGPKEGDKEYVFPVGFFFTFLNATGVTDAGKSHQFHITVTDLEGNSTTEQTFKVTITE